MHITILYEKTARRDKQMGYDGVLKFKGTWRKYQARVLENANKYLMDQHVHIVAAPGSGKTTLGIELIKRIGRPALVFAPSITIREQWVARIEEAFLCEGLKGEDYLSQDLKHPKMITVSTYQSLHSAINRYKGTEEEVSSEAEDKDVDDTALVKAEEVDYSDFDIIQMVTTMGFGVMCLDECHHLRSEWWKALEEFKSHFQTMKTIALTATPPYDSTPAMWTRYMGMCGEIDEEITIPELVKEGSLCPHQDYVYFNYPTKEEEAEVEKFQARSLEMTEKLMQDKSFLDVIRTHKSLEGTATDDQLLNDPGYFSSLLICYQSAGIPFPSRLQRLLGAKKLPPMAPKWMEKLLQGFLYDDADSFACDKVFREQLKAELKAAGLLEKNKVAMVAKDSINKMLTRSKGKCNSISKIVFHEYEATGNELRLLVLTDYIKKEYEKALGNPQADITALGVLPFFEQLRRENEKQGKQIRFAVLCGTIVIIPAEAKEQLTEVVGDAGKVTFSKVGSLPEQDYVKVTAVGDAHFLTGAVTELFSRGCYQVVIGTKSLLGEGWDSPCINSLILASFVGSFMLSNQMRGRAIRVFKDKPDKTSNIWHLVCLNKWQEVKKDLSEGKTEISEDFELLARRMDNFLGLHYTENTIENGINRLSIIKPPYNEGGVSGINKKMLEMSGKRSELKSRWQSALAVYDKMEIAEETKVDDKAVTAVVFHDAIRKSIISGILTIAAVTICNAGWSGKFISFVATLAALFGGISFLCTFPKVLSLGSPMKRIKVMGRGVLKALQGKGMIEGNHMKVETTELGPVDHAIYLAGGSGKDKALFAQCVCEMMAEVDNQRYLMVKKRNRGTMDGFYCVPECFGKKKEDAQYFADCVKSVVDGYELVYTRNESGREYLLEGRVKALTNREERCINHKKVKSVLE